MRKNILILGHGYGTQFVDVNNQYTRLFDPDQYEVTVAYLVGKPDAQIKQRHITEHVLFLDPPKESMRSLKTAAIKQVIKLCKEKKFEIVICHRYKPIYVMLWAALFCKIPVIFAVMHELGTMAHFTRKMVVAALAQKNFVLAGVSDAVRDDLRRDTWGVPSERIITLYNMIDVEFTKSHLLERDAARQALNILPETFVFGNIGRLAINKDHKTLIHAFAAIKPQCPNAKLVIIGDGQLEDELKQLAERLQVTSDIIFTGFLASGFCYMKAFDILVSASIQEAFGRVLLEAMIAQTPIIATRVNGVPEVIGATGPLIPAGQVECLATEMLKAYKHSLADLSAWGKMGYQRAMENFSLQRFNQIFWSLPIIRERCGSLG